jgi:hypothetical protein
LRVRKNNYICIIKQSHNTPGQVDKVGKNIMNTSAVNHKGERIIVAFHIGRGGRFHNQGHSTYIGEKNFQDLIQLRSNDLFYRDRDMFGRFCKPYIVDCNDTTIVEAEDMTALVGKLDYDGDYDSHVACYLDECDEETLKQIADSGEWLSSEIKEYIKEQLGEEEEYEY